MAINKLVMAALKALSYPDIDIKRNYKWERQVENVAHYHYLKPFYKAWDHKVSCGDHEVPVRIFSPPGRMRHAILLFFHGGGWVLGGIGSCARFCAELAAAGHVLVLAADYRLAPEHPFPQGLDDCMRAVETALRRASEWGGSPERVSVGGDSSGGNLALAVALRRRAEGLPPLRSLVLFYPVVTARADGSASWKRYGQGVWG
mgnify:CR=1 FL=1